MKANELQIINFLQTPRVQCVIPVYQWNYDWTPKECEELLKKLFQFGRKIEPLNLLEASFLSMKEYISPV